MKNLLLQRGSIFSYVLSVMGIVMMLGISTNVHAKAELALQQSVEGDVEEVLSGQPFTFKFQYRCASTTEDCDNVQLVSTLPSEVVDILQEIAPTHSVHVESHSVVDNVVTWQFIDPLPAGSTGEVTMVVKLKTGETPNNTLVTSSANISSDNADDIEDVISMVNVTAESVITITKVSKTTGHRLDFEARYRVEMCNEGGDGKLDLNNVSLVDQLPAGTTYMLSTRNGVYNADADTVVWPTKDLKVGECFTYHDIIVIFPSSNFAVG
ncbi:hypothetical protein QUF50_08655, partial [Thiotrichales bacterium HSG1]|nr:hypothetical protein [Thiotrichales bacterium HSG1]